MKKRKGSILDSLIILFSVLAMFILMLAYLGCVRIIELKDGVSQIARNYILKMETVGYLTPSDRAGLEQELTALGMTDINLTGTTISDVGYGNQIYLHITGNIQGEKMSGSDLFSIVFEAMEYTIEENRASTAKN